MLALEQEEEARRAAARGAAARAQQEKEEEEGGQHWNSDEEEEVEARRVTRAPCAVPSRLTTPATRFRFLRLALARVPREVVVRSPRGSVDHLTRRRGAERHGL